MNRNRCEREIEVVDALRSGVWNAELSGHVGSCAVCAETKRVAGSLLQYASVLKVESEPAMANRIWRRAQAQRQEMILKRATRPLIFMRTISLGCVAAFAAWLLRGFSHPGYGELLRGWDLVGAPALGATVAVLCIAVGAGYLLHEGKRSGEVDVFS
jgi:hypothetical protein